jgi:hypothetical protein
MHVIGVEQMQPSNSWVTVYVPLASSLVAALATVVLAWLTARYVRVTAELLEESRRSRLPSVSLDFELPDHALRFVVANDGGSAARNIRFDVLKDVAWIRRMKASSGLAHLPPFTTGISYLAPARRLKYHFGYPNWKDVSSTDMMATIRVAYEDTVGNQHTDTVNYDFTQMREVLFESFQDPTRAVAQAIRDAESQRHSSQRFARMFSQGPFPGLRKACPMCGEMIAALAKKCPHCREMLTESDTPSSDAP